MHALSWLSGRCLSHVVSAVELKPLPLLVTLGNQNSLVLAHTPPHPHQIVTV